VSCIVIYLMMGTCPPQYNVSGGEAAAQRRNRAFDEITP
jgi:hypothetical protein